MQEFNEKTARHQIACEAYGLPLRICTNSPELLALIERMLPPGWRRRPRSSSQHRLGLLSEGNDIYSIYRQDGLCIHDAPGRDYALVTFERLLQGLVALESPDFIFVHAGVVAHGGHA